MISVISLCRHPESNAVQKGNIAKAVGAAYEYLVIDGSKGPYRVAPAYNWAVGQMKGDIAVFLHDDCYFMNMNWGQAIEAKFAADPSLGVAGVAGTQHLFADKASWTAAGRPFVKGRIVYHLQNGDFFAAALSQEKGDFEVVALDGCFLAIRAPLCRTVRFDEAMFGGAHFWDLDFCLRARSSARVIVSSEVTVKKMAQLEYDSAWQEAGAVFLRKHAAVLPASCAQYPGAPLPGPSSQMVNLKGKYSPDTIC